MANLIITAKASAFKSRGIHPKAFNYFENAEGTPCIVLPTAKNGTVSWNVPDTPLNRSLIRKDFAGSEVYSCKSIDMENPEPFEAGAKENAEP